MELREVFAEMIEKEGISILDNPKKCKGYLLSQSRFYSSSINENPLTVDLFFDVLEKNVPLQIRKKTDSHPEITRYNLVIDVYIDTYKDKKNSNERENILINHISLITSVLEQQKIIFPKQYTTKTQTQYIIDLSNAVNILIKTQGIQVLENPKQVFALLQDFTGSSITNEVKSFVEFLRSFNKKSELKDTEETEKNIILLKTVLHNNGANLSYLDRLYMKYDSSTKEKTQNSNYTSERTGSFYESVGNVDTFNLLKRTNNKDTVYNRIKNILYGIFKNHETKKKDINEYNKIFLRIMIGIVAVLVVCCIFVILIPSKTVSVSSNTSSQFIKQSSQTQVQNKSGQSQTRQLTVSQQKSLDDSLITAVENFDTNKISSLVRQGANINAKGGYGRTVLMIAAYNNNIEAVKILIQSHASINASANDGKTALILASQEDNSAIVKLLVEAGANINIKDNFGNTALDFAKENGNTTIVNMLTNLNIK